MVVLCSDWGGEGGDQSLGHDLVSDPVSESEPRRIARVANLDAVQPNKALVSEGLLRDVQRVHCQVDAPRVVGCELI